MSKGNDQSERENAGNFPEMMKQLPTNLSKLKEELQQQYRTDPIEVILFFFTIAAAVPLLLIYHHYTFVEFAIALVIYAVPAYWGLYQIGVFDEENK